MINNQTGKTIVTLVLTLIIIYAAQSYIVFDEEILIAFAFVCFVLFVYGQVKQSVREEFASYSEKLSKDFFTFQEVLLNAVKKLSEQQTASTVSHTEEVQFIAQNLFYTLSLLKKKLAASLLRSVNTYWGKVLDEVLTREHLKFQTTVYQLLATVALSFIQSGWYSRFVFSKKTFLDGKKATLKAASKKYHTVVEKTLVVGPANLNRLSGVFQQVAATGFGQRTTFQQKESLNGLLASSSFFRLDSEFLFFLIQKA